MNPAFLKKIKRNDRLARWLITAGGMMIIFSVIFILVLIAKVSLPLFFSPSAQLYSSLQLQSVEQQNILAIGMDEYLETGYTLDDRGELVFFSIKGGRELSRQQFSSDGTATRLLSVESFGHQKHALLWDDGSVTVEQVRFTPVFDADNDNQRSIVYKLERLARFVAPESGRSVQTLVRVDAQGRQTRVDLLAEGTIELYQRAVTENFLGDAEVFENQHQLDATVNGRISTLTLSSNGRQLYAGTDRGELLRWDLSDIDAPERVDQLQAFADQRAITALNLVFGDISLAVGDDRGGITTWFPVRKGEQQPVLTRIHELSGHHERIEMISPSSRDKTVFSLSADGLRLDHMTSERFLLQLNPPGKIARFALTTRGNALIALTKENTLLSWKLEIPHPEVSFGTLFGKVWYENYPEPVYAWQSSSASDDYEPKMSLAPLIFGTLKGTFYAMLFAVPLAIFGAIYTSQFARPRLRGVIKPAVEVMAAIPTVIIGFLAALWLAPLIERSLGSLFLSLILVPAALMLSILFWQGARKFESLKRVERGFEFLAIAPVIIMAVAIAATLGPGVENLLFAGNLKQWLFTEMGTRYDPRNSIIIAFAMGFAVIPILFTIAEDSLSNVPPSLKAASLALGASRWQTVWRVILPSASPGIFAGTMIGFGRAVGETMIVLMATGNTAIIDLSIFNGMRPLSANIAVEIPEAPVDGSLYRVLFLSAVILFVMTFVVNTLAEIVRQRLRAKYGRF
ncbi:MAG: ABC transporter permease subunit [Desulfuromonadales bacterium]|nr:ABC transporter permease subunit [Desulfuromonadales bacterium]